jgi:uncharacterized membrane protein
VRLPKPVVLRSGVLLLLSIATIIVFAAGWHSAVRTAIALAFLLFAPGWALADLIAIRDPLQQLALATGASLALETVVSLVFLYAGAFSIDNVLAVVASLTILMVAVTLVRESS